MLLSARQFGNAEVLEAEVAVVGGGVCGLVLARELDRLGCDVLLLESGSVRSDPRAQELNAGDVAGDPYAGLTATRHRQLGGTAHTWNTPVDGELGAKYAPLDPHDLEGWPIPWPELEPWYRAAHAACGLGPYAYDAASWSDPARPPWTGPDDLLENRVYQFGRGSLFTRRYPAELGASTGVRLLTGATVTALQRDRGRVRGLEVRRSDGRELHARARQVVLAAGGIENARLLLASGFSHDWLGRGFMEHPRDYSMSLLPSRDDDFRSGVFYDAHRAGDGTVICGRLGVTAAARHREALPSASVSLLLRPRERRPSAGLRVMRRLGLAPAPPGGGYGWSTREQRSRDFDAYQLVVNLEQQPHRENRVTLGPEADRHGVPRALLHYHWRPDEQERLDRLRRRLAGWFAAGGHGRLEYREGVPPDPNAHHHMGTTRMAADPDQGVLTAESRVHGVENLFVAGSSAFPTAGFANPTLTAVALSLRLAHHLRAVPGPR